MENPIIVPFDLNTARKIKSGEIEGSVLIGNIKIEFVYESKDCADRYNLLFVKKDESGISAIYADTEGRTFFNNVLEQDFMEFLRNVAADIWVEYTEPEQRSKLFNLMNKKNENSF